MYSVCVCAPPVEPRSASSVRYFTLTCVVRACVSLWHRRGARCVWLPLHSSIHSLLVGIFFGLIAVAAWTLSDDLFDVILFLLGLFQIIGEVGQTSRTGQSAVTLKIFDYLQLILFETSFVRPGCLTGPLPYTTTALASLAFFGVAWAPAFGGLYVVYRLRRHGTYSAKAIAFVRGRVVRLGVVAYTLLYNQLLTISLTSLYCEDSGGGELRMKLEPNVACMEGAHFILAAVSIVILPTLLFPPFYGWRYVRRRRGRMEDERMLSKYGFSYAPFFVDMYEFFMWEFILQFGFVGMSMIFADEETEAVPRNTGTLVLTLVYTVATFLYDPFRSSLEKWFLYIRVSVLLLS
eukprot:GFYU01022236.1.p1 GENE.GFYU01022236.1~~GFYU01022236.1.p1  ORF type:complete len:349 (+),score=52.22 GFYU01022236.1:263-1309(+)